MHPIIDTLAKIKLSHGKHDSAKDGLCVMECVAYVAGEPHTDHPECACPVVTEVAIYANDYYQPQHGEALARRVVELAGSKVGPTPTHARIYFLSDYVFRIALPAAFHAENPALAAILRALPVFDSFQKTSSLNNVRESLFGLSTEQGNLLAGLTGRVMRDLKGLEDMKSPEDQGLLFGNVTHIFMLILAESKAPVDILKLLDELLAIGKKKEVPATPEMKLRIAMLATDTQIAGNLKHV